MEITNLCFADDLIVLCNGDINYVKVIKLALEELCVSGLYPNMGKSTMFGGNLSTKVETEILQIVHGNSSSKGNSMHTFWATVFFLPKTVIKDIDSILKSFLWSQWEKIQGKVRIAWKDVCKSKKSGGLGLKPLGKWNEILMVKHIWNIASKKDTLWVKWINEHMLKGRSVWAISDDPKASWGWRKLLDLRDMVRDHI
ncbi:hypothetical protein Tco_1158699 [Tanacetum coccineum]